MRVLVTGATGQLGYDTSLELLRRGHEVIGTGTGEASPIPEGASAPSGCFTYMRLQLTDTANIREVFDRAGADAVIHCASWTAVDDAEKPENRETVRQNIIEGTRVLAQCCREADVPMLHISTDYVFDGSGTEPIAADATSFGPLNVYGQAKLEAEQLVRDILTKYFVVRVSWTYGVHGRNFVKTILRLAQTHDTLKVVNDQIGTPTSTADLAVLLADMIITDRYGTYNAANSGGYISWYEFACEIVRQAGYAVTIIPVTTQEYGLSAAARPHNSRLDCRKLTEKGFATLRDWKSALADFLKKL